MTYRHLFRFGFGLALTTVAMAAAGEEIPAAPPIEAVTVFPRSADVTRVGPVTLPAGEHQIVVEGLPVTVDANSLRTRFGSDAIIVGAVEAVREDPPSEGPPDAEALLARLQELRDQLQAQEDRSAIAAIQIRFLENRAAAGPSEGGETPAMWETALAAIGEGGLAARAAILSAEQAKRAITEEIEAIEQALRDWRNALAPTTTARITLTAETAVTTDMVLQYQVSRASWTALYDARLDSEASTLQLDRKVRVTQSSGEDWENVALRLSTAPPTTQMDPPKVFTRFLDFLEEEELFAAESAVESPAPMRDEQLRRSTGLAMQDQMVVTGSRARAVETVDASFASTYAVGGRVDVASDGVARTFTVGQEDIAVELTIRTAPRLNTDAFVVAKVTYAGDGPLPGGPLRKYRDGAYLREDRIETLIPGEAMELGFGVDEAVIVTWTDEGAGAESDVGLMGRTREIGENHLYEAVNRHDGPYTVEIVDYRPVPQDEAITVRVSPDATAPDEETFADQPGVFVWRSEVAAGETLAVRNAYTIRYPADETLVQ